ncbi:ExbD/TolR family protein [Planctomycetota bacterium]
MAVEFQKSAALQSLSLTPLIDVVFLLLIFFMVSTRFAEEDRELDVELPSASQATPMAFSPDDVEIYIGTTGEYYLGSQGPYDLEGVEQLLADLATNSSATRAVKIRADLRCNWNHVVKAIDACHKQGLHDVKATAAVEPK